MSNTIAVDPAANAESDSYQTGSECSMVSLNSSAYQYRYENGRRYHAYKDGQYAFPNDEKEQDRLDIIHHICLLVLEDKLHMAPIGNNPNRILDIGTGTGIWAIDVAERYPSAEVIGTDLSPIQPSWIPPNAQFQIDDAEGDWTWGADSFDFIHIRHLSGAIKDWPRLIRQAFKHLRPGGWVEFNEYDMNAFSDDGTLTEKSLLWKFFDLANKAAKKTGREFNAAANIKPIMEKSGFDDIHYEQFKLPIGTWPADKRQKEIGAYVLLNGETGFEAIGTALFTRELGMDLDQAREVVSGAEKDAKNRRIHSYSRLNIFWGRKPPTPHV